MVDQLIYSLNEISQQVLPILGAVVLIMLIVLLRNLISFIKECTERMKQLENTVVSVDKSLEKIQEPLNTVVKVTHGVDKAYDSTENAIKNAAAYVSTSYENYACSKTAKKDGQAAFNNENQ